MIGQNRLDYQWQASIHFNLSMLGQYNVIFIGTTISFILYLLLDTKLVIYDSRTPDCRTAETITADHKTADSRTLSPASSSTVKSSQQQPGMNCNPSKSTLLDHVKKTKFSEEGLKLPF